MTPAPAPGIAPGSSQCRRESQPFAFTLIELLVAVVIVTLLVAIALPAIRHTQLTARTTKCLSNARQIGVLLNAYLVTSNGLMPTLHNRESTTLPLPAMDTVLLDGQGKTSQGVFDCPADHKDLFETSGASYFWNFLVNGQKIESLFSMIGGREASKIPLISDKEGWHPELRDKVVILYADGHAAKELVFLTDLPPEATPP